MSTEILSLSGSDVESLLDLDAAMASQRAAFVALARGAVDLPPKIMHPSRFDDSVVLAYVARVSGRTGAVAKIGSVNPGNAGAGLPTVSAIVVALDPGTGRPVAIVDGVAITTLRTAAASAVAVDALARADAGSLGVLGSGVQGRAHVRAIARVRPLRTVRVWSPTAEHRERAAAELAGELGIDVRAVDGAERAVAGMDIVAACTLSRQPVVRGEWLGPECTVVSVGSFEPGRREVDREVIRRAGAVVVDDPGTAVEHAGPVMDARLGPADLVPLGAVLAGDRSVPSGIVFYNSVGLGVQDAAAAWAVIDAARARR
ncbi:MAG TPA: ornithine cyclodeaminase family protein [Actinophytocola sp.]|uniref:ornithine cyclodeaminase family protein n=1 Tax=Actinophytocola sp. TaxID=1872138 RepID=UPI002DDCFB81|nr:ornithine cyclodeaminase family protein [Actinophytocola sp.]HEV2778347.1 ornithine cyclodeaminase family protein [Actinophytocola sp.]